MTLVRKRRTQLEDNATRTPYSALVLNIKQCATIIIAKRCSTTAVTVGSIYMAASILSSHFRQIWVNPFVEVQKV